MSREPSIFTRRPLESKFWLILKGDDGEITHVELAYKDAVIMLGSEVQEEDGVSKSPSTLGGSCVGLYLYIEDVDSLYKQAVDAGAKTVTELTDMFWGDRMCVLLDPEGHKWAFATCTKEPTPEEIASWSAGSPSELAEPKMMDKDEFHVVGLSGDFTAENTSEIPKLWERFIPRLGEIQNKKEFCFGLCECGEEEGKNFTYTAGFEVSSLDNVPEGMVGKTIPQNHYGVFTHKGPISKIGQTFDSIYHKWLPNSPFKRGTGPDFEFYGEKFNGQNPEAPDSEVDIYMPLVKK